MCTPTIAIGVAVGAGVGAATSAITGQDPLMGALMGGAMGGFTAGLSPGTMGMTGVPGLDPLGTSFYIGPVGIAGGAFGSSVAMSTVGGLALGMLTPQQQDYSQYYQGAYGSADPIAYNTQQSVVTGSGGRQASALLAEEIKRVKKRRAAQADVGDIDLATSLSNTGLQIA